MEYFWCFAGLTILLLCYAIFSCLEKALLSLSVFQILQLNETEERTSQILFKLLHQSAQFFSTVFILKFFVIFFFIWGVFQWIPEQILALAFEYKLLIIGFLIFITELLVSIPARNRPLQIAKISAIPMVLFFYILYPITWITRIFLGKKFEKQTTNISLDEISEVIENTDLSREKDQDEANLLKGVIRFGDIEAKAVMRERIMVTAIEKNMSFEKLLDLLIESGYSRFPVYNETLDNIAGILVLKDLLPLMNGTEKGAWQSKIRPAFFVEENTKIDDLLPAFQSKKVHFAIVVDEYGGTSGIITLEDILEEIIGEIVDEYDDVEEETTGHKIDDQSWEFEANTSIIDFCKILDLDEDFFDDAHVEAESLGGLVLELNGEFPKQNAEIKFKNLIFQVLELNERRITKLLVFMLKEKK